MTRALRGVGWLPLFHDMGLVGHVLQPVYVGGFSALMSPLLFLQRPSRWLQAISDWKATTSGGPSYAFDLCVKSIRDDQLENLDLSSWRVAYCGAEKVRADVLERFSDRFAKYGFQRRALLPCFGLAEASLLVTGARRETGINVAEPARDLNRWGSAVNCGPAGCRSSVIICESRYAHDAHGRRCRGDLGPGPSRCPRLLAPKQCRQIILRSFDRWLRPVSQNRRSRVHSRQRFVRGRTNQKHDHRQWTRSIAQRTSRQP